MSSPSNRQPIDTCAELAVLLTGNRIEEIIAHDIRNHSSIHDMDVWKRIIRERFKIHSVPDVVTEAFVARL
jgi:hypothetical protein